MKVSNWGQFPVIEGQLKRFESVESLSKFTREQDNLIARGNGRCYGDASLNEMMVSSTHLRSLLNLDETNSTITCQAGILLSEILEIIVPKGLFLPVTPGTKYVTLGGAIASDVHGKNHHRDGCISRYVVGMQVMTVAGNLINCSPEDNQDLFWATCGGMGLTGIITEATISLIAIETTYIHQINESFSGIGELLSKFNDNKNSKYSVAWVDNVNLKRGGMVNGIFMKGEHADSDQIKNLAIKDHLRIPAKRRINIPFNFPSITVNKSLISIYNHYFYWRSMRKKDDFVDYETYFYPLDGVRNWNRLYGRNGFTQYQIVIPDPHIEQAWGEFIELMKVYGQYSFLTVLKMFGEGNSYSPLSFPIPGLSIAFDFKMHPKIFPMLDEMDKIVVKFGGRNYLAKDSRMSSDTFSQMYGTERFSELLASFGTTSKFRSLQSKRLGIT